MAPTSAGPKTLGGVVVDDSPGGVVDYMRNMTEDDFTNWCVCMIEMQEKMGYVKDPGLHAEVDELIRFLKDEKEASGQGARERSASHCSPTTASSTNSGHHS